MVDVSQLLDLNRQVLTSDDSITLLFQDKGNALKINFEPLQISLVTKENLNLSHSNKKSTFLAIYGILKLKDINYLVLVNKANIVGQILEKQIFQAEKFEFIPLSRNKKISSNDQKYVTHLQSIFDTKTFYYSEDYDLTSSLQTANLALKEPISQYFINEHLTTKFIRSQLEQYVPIFISGLVQIKHANLNGYDCDFILISRRDKRRMGRRFISRGADLDGNCSNFAETEQIFCFGQQKEVTVFSFLQTRGSMPFKWKQKPTLKWAPKGQILGSDEKNLEICRRHFNHQNYQKQVLINLIDKKGTQLMLGTYFQKLIQNLNNPNLKYVWFDFHHECRKMKYENLSRLIEMIKNNMNQYGQYSMKYNRTKPTQVQIMTKQSGVIRTNCMDCLDRTNVVQSVVARHQLWNVLTSIGIHRPGQGAFDKFPDQLETIFRDVWTKNADVVSLLYTGTGALKTDFTKTGKRTFKGSLQDGRNSLVRYVIGNFQDADIQNSFDLLTGKLNMAFQSYSPSGLTTFLLLALMFILLPYVIYQLSHHALQYDNVLGLFGESNNNQTSFYNIKMTILPIVFILISLSVLQKIIMGNYKQFVKRPLIDH